jgi:hypothetical protein
MKTAMQLMLEDLEFRYKVLSDAQMLQACAAIEGTIEYAKSLTIKEKEQIIDAHLNGQSDHHFSLESRTLEAEQHYDKTYNQKK